MSKKGRGKKKEENVSVDTDKDTSLNGNKKKGGRKEKEYIPKTRSGAYAILITLYHAQDRYNYPGYMTKVELQKEAQPRCDQNFSSNSHSEFYTAWSSTKTLLKRELITRWSNPAKYNITDKGIQLANRIIFIENNPNASFSSQSSTSSPSQTQPKKSKPKPRAKKTPNRSQPSPQTSHGLADVLGYDLDDLSFSESFSELPDRNASQSRPTASATVNISQTSNLQSSYVASSHLTTSSTRGVKSLLDVPDDGLHHLLKHQKSYMA